MKLQDMKLTDQCAGHDIAIYLLTVVAVFIFVCLFLIIAIEFFDE